MAKWQVKYNLGGGFGGVRNVEWETIEATDRNDAENEAYRLACEVYDSYDGLHGLRDVQMIMEEEEIEDEDEAYEIWKEERESWLDWSVREYVEGQDDEEGE